MKKAISIILIAALLIAALPVQCFAASNTIPVLLEVTVDNAPIRAASNKNGKVIARCAKGSVLTCTGSCINSAGNRWYKVEYDDWYYYIYSGNVKTHTHTFEYIDYDGVSYRYCDCGLVQVPTKTQAKQAATMTPYLSAAVGVAALDGPVPLGDIIGVTIILVGSMLTYGVTKNVVTEVVENIDLSRYARSNSCSTASYRAVSRAGGKLTYLDDACLNLGEAFVYTYFAGGDVYTQTYAAAEELAMLGGDHFTEIDKDKPDYYYHFHYGTKNPRYTVGGHIFYGATPSGLTPQ